jgi:hypothetical protein
MQELDTVKMKKTKFIEITVKMLVAALTAFLTALTTASCVMN